jgi:hypothetical protein
MTTTASHQSPIVDPEETDLERRVLAHERILQALIAHMAESQPKFFERLTAVFSGPARAGRREHDYTDTDAYADQFVRKIQSSGALPKESAAPFHGEQPSGLDPTADAAMEPRKVDPTLFQLSYRGGIWEITKDGNFYGHYHLQQPAFDAVEAAAHAVVAGGGCADILLRGERPRSMPAT